MAGGFTRSRRAPALRWRRGGVFIELTPGRRNLLRIRRPWSDRGAPGGMKAAETNHRGGPLMGDIKNRRARIDGHSTLGKNPISPRPVLRPQEGQTMAGYESVDARAERCEEEILDNMVRLAESCEGTLGNRIRAALKMH
jgi:hypothetical protein